jgi:tRNA pseudouridine32 synthase/23S rRNA pseudouridine746 synthase
MKFEQHFKIEISDKTAVDALEQSTELTRQAIKQAMTKGAVWLTRNKSTQRIRRADKPLKPGDELHLYFDSNILEVKPQAATPLADEDAYSIWYKPYGMLCQGSKWGDHCTINRWSEKHLVPQRPAFIVHRLDRAATGLIIIAHKKNVAAYFANLFQQREIEKKYQAIVEGQLLNSLKLDSDIEAKPALSYVKAIRYNAEANQSLVEVTIETGRKHQIRRHLSEAGFPIVGDRLYGQGNTNSSDLCLASCHLSFPSPIDGTTKSYWLPEQLGLRL